MIINSVPINFFDRSKPFYPLIMNYVIFLIGFKEVALRGVIKELEMKSGETAEPYLPVIKKNILHKLSASEKEIVKIEQQLSKLLGPLELKSEFQGNYIKVEVDDIAEDLCHNVLYLIKFTMNYPGSLLILAHEISKDKSWYDRGPLWEFLRHCRNAAAHGGLFTFKGQEPCRPAEWGHFRIERGLEGTPLFKYEKASGLLSPGDPIRLLWDIEQAYPSMVV